MKLAEMSDLEELNGYAETTDNSNSNSELIERIQVENTPFTVIRQEEKWYVTLGMYRLTNDLENKEDAIADAQREDWERLMQVMGIMIENYKPNKE